MSLIPDELKAQRFPCPTCSEYINDEAEVCKFCLTLITARMRNLAIDKERAEKKAIFLGNQRKTLVTGLIVVGVGLINILLPMFDFYVHSFGTRIPCLSSIAIVVGIGVTVLGLQGYFKEKRN